MLKRVGKIKVIAPQSLDAGTYVLAGETSLRSTPFIWLGDSLSTSAVHKLIEHFTFTEQGGVVGFPGVVVAYTAG